MNSLAPGRCDRNFKCVISNSLYRIIAAWEINCCQVNATETHWWEVNIGSCNGLVPSSNKRLPGQHWPRLCFYQTRSTWSMDHGSTRKRSAVHNFGPTVTRSCVMWEGLSLPHGTTFGNCRGEIVDRSMLFIWSLIHVSGWTGFIKAEPDLCCYMASPGTMCYNGVTIVNDIFISNLYLL